MKDKEVSMLNLARTNRSWVLFTISILIFVLLLGVSAYIIYSPNDNIYQGQIEVSELRISGKLPGRIAKYRVSQGDFVKKGDTLVEIYSPELLAKEEQAEAADKLTEAIRDGVNSQSRSEIRQMTLSAYNAAVEARIVGEKSYERAKKLYEEGVIPAQKFDEAEAKLSALKSAEEFTREQYKLAEKGIFTKKKEVANAMVDRSKALMDELQSFMSERTLTSPIDGKVSTIFPKVGELVGTGAPIMNIANSNDTKVLFAVREDKLGLFPIGSEIEAKIIALGNKSVKLKVSSYRDLGVYAVSKSSKSRDAIDYRNFEVTMYIIGEIEGIEAGMSVIVEKK